MASLKDVPAEHQTEARLVPDKLRAKLSPAELAYRARKAHAIREQAPPTGEAGRAMRTHAASFLYAMPLPDYLEQRDKLRQLEAEASGDRNDEGKAPKDAYRAALRELADQNTYPAGLAEAATERAAGREANPVFDGCNLDEVLGLGPSDETIEQAAAAEDAAWGVLTAGLTKGATTTQLAKRATLAKGVKAEVAKVVKARFGSVADLDKAIAARRAQIDELHAEIRKFKESGNARAEQAGTPVPFREVQASVQATTRKAQATELKAEVKRLGELSKDLSLDPDLRAYYGAQFEEKEKELTGFLRNNMEGI